MKEILTKLTSGLDLSEQEAKASMETIMSGKASEVEISAYLVALKMKGESPQEIAALAQVMREYATRIEPKVKGILVDMCGTGGDSSGTFNISTAAMFVVVASGIPVAKHGNRGITSKSGSADVLEAMGARIDLTPDEIKSAIESIGIGFMFAPNHHPAMKHVMPVRKQLGFRTVFNILGPLTNPAGAQAQLMGVFDPNMTDNIAEVFRILGLKRALVVNGEPGIDELSVIGPTRISELARGEVKTRVLDPRSLGLSGGTLEDLRGGDAVENAQIIRGILNGEIFGPKRDIVLLNAAGGIITGGLADDFTSALKIAINAVESGDAMRKLEDFVAYTKELR